MRDARCPWCTLARRGLHYFVKPGTRRDAFTVDESIWQHGSNAEVERVWAEIAGIAPPTPVSVAIPSRTYQRGALRLWTMRRRLAYAAGAAVVMLAAVGGVMRHVPILSVLALAAGLFSAAAFRPDARDVVARAWRRQSDARRAYAAALGEWEREARGMRFHDARARLARIRNDLLDQRRRYDADIATIDAIGCAANESPSWKAGSSPIGTCAKSIRGRGRGCAPTVS